MKTVVLKFDKVAGEYWWTCPECGREQFEYLDEQGQVLCENCDQYFFFDKEGEPNRPD